MRRPSACDISPTFVYSTRRTLDKTKKDTAKKNQSPCLVREQSRQEKLLVSRPSSYFWGVKDTAAELKCERRQKDVQSHALLLIESRPKIIVFLRHKKSDVFRHLSFVHLRFFLYTIAGLGYSFAQHVSCLPAFGQRYVEYEIKHMCRTISPDH